MDISLKLTIVSYLISYLGQHDMLTNRSNWLQWSCCMHVQLEMLLNPSEIIKYLTRLKIKH